MKGIQMKKIIGGHYVYRSIVGWVGTLPNGESFSVRRNGQKVRGRTVRENWYAKVTDGFLGVFGRTAADAIDALARAVDHTQRVFPEAWARGERGTMIDRIADLERQIEELRGDK